MDKILCGTNIQMKAVIEYFGVVLFITLCGLVITLESVVEIASVVIFKGEVSREFDVISKPKNVCL